MSSKAIISAVDLTKYYGSFVGTNKITFEVNEGEIFGFLGPNGAGKTTTIRMLLDLLRPDSGEIRIFDKDIKTESFSIRKQIGYLPGEFAAYSHLTGYEYCRLVARIRGIPFDVSSSLFDLFSLSEKDLRKKTRALSHGTLQKIGIIQALCHQPRLLILDEPTTGLDPLMKELFYKVLLEKQQEGTTIFFSSHNLDEVEKLCNRVAIIRKGEIAGLETIEALKEKAGQMVEFTTEEDQEIHEIPDAVLIDQWNHHYKYRFNGDIKLLISKLNRLNLKNLSISKPDLEEIFVEYYQDEHELF